MRSFLCRLWVVPRRDMALVLRRLFLGRFAFADNSKASDGDHPLLSLSIVTNWKIGDPSSWNFLFRSGRKGPRTIRLEKEVVLTVQLRQGAGKPSTRCLPTILHLGAPKRIIWLGVSPSHTQYSRFRGMLMNHGQDCSLGILDGCYCHDEDI